MDTWYIYNLNIYKTTTKLLEMELTAGHFILLHFILFYFTCLASTNKTYDSVSSISLFRVKILWEPAHIFFLMEHKNRLNV